MTPAQTLAAREAGVIEPFRHADHVAAAWEALRREPFDVAAARICGAIQRYAAQRGAAGKYDHAMTMGFLRLIDARKGSLDWPAFVAVNPGLFDRTDRDVRRLLRRRPRADLLALRAGVAGVLGLGALHVLHEPPAAAVAAIAAVELAGALLLVPFARAGALLLATSLAAAAAVHLALARPVSPGLLVPALALLVVARPKDGNRTHVTK